MAHIGYARISDTDDDMEPQLASLAKVKCLQIFQDRVSGAKAERPGLAETLSYLRKGDVLVVTRLDRLGKSLSHLVATISELTARGIGFKSLEESIDTTSANGPFILSIFSAMAQFDRNLIHERTRAGLAAIVAHGRVGGRKPVITKDKMRKAKALVAEGVTVREAAARIGVGKSALYEALRAEAEKKSQQTVSTSTHSSRR